MLTALKICLPLLAIWIALCLVCALRVTRRRRTGDGQTGASWAAGDPYFHPFGEMPIVPPRREQLARDFRAWGIPQTNLRPSGGALRVGRTESDGRSASTSGTAVVLTFPERT